MKQYFIFSVLYFCISILVIYIWREDPLTSLLYFRRNTAQLVRFLLQFSTFMMLFGVVLSVFLKSRNPRDIVISVVMGFSGTVLFLSAYGLTKTTLPDIVTFYADPFFAKADNLLHGGVDPWIVTHRYRQFLPIDWIPPVYLNVWMYPAALLPVFVAAFDSDVERVRRVLTGYISAWVIVGNIFALAGMSVGPVFYDRLLGTERFSELTNALWNSGVTQGKIGLIQAHLWENHLANEQSLNIGISAFPSVHVAVAAVTAIYLGERSRLLWPVGIAFMITILFLSIYSGYHYAVDGCVSILIVFIVWRWTKGRSVVDWRAFANVPINEK